MCKKRNKLTLKNLREKMSNKIEMFNKIHNFDKIYKKERVDVLIINEDPTENFVCIKYLRDYMKIKNIVSIHSPKEAIHYLNSLKIRFASFPKLIIFDNNIGGISGDEFLETLKNEFNRKKTKLIIFTKEEYLEEDIELKDNTLIGRMSKPIDINFFKTIIKNNFKF